MAWRDIIRTVVWLLLIGAILFAAAGDLYWPQGWVLLAEIGISSFAFGIGLTRSDPALLASRLASPFHRDQGVWDRVFVACVGIGFFAWMVLAALDARRYRWTATPLWAQALGAALIAVCMVGVWYVFRANSFAAPQVRIQAERGQAVATTGPYRLVRHPMYAAAIVYFIGLPLLLGSLWALAAVPLFVLAFAWRTIGEERLLRQSLPGYTAYADKVRYRFVPGIW